MDRSTGALIPLTHGLALDEAPAWSRQSPSQIVEAEEVEGSPLFVEVTAPVMEGHGHPYGFVHLPGVDVLLPELSDRVDDSFNALRARVVEETGYDFMARLSEALRPIDFSSDYSEYLSWHKAGRAIDFLWDFNDGAQPLLEVVQEEIGERVYWRLFLRCAAQDGSQGAPLQVNPWDLSYRARWIETQGEGGRPKPIPYGYYVDLTDLARAYGWRRISSYEEEEFDWRTNFLALEYWHYQKTDGLIWYRAMREVYSEEELTRHFAWEELMAHGLSRSFLTAKGIPRPPLIIQEEHALPR
jgi:TolB protein